MSSPPPVHTIDDETLAAFADGKLAARESAVVRTHLAECADCVDTINMIGELRAAAVVPNETNVVRSNRFGYAVPLLAAAAAAAVVFFLPPVQERIANYRAGGGVPALVKASQELKKRDIEARLSGEFPHIVYEGPKRSADSEPRPDRHPLNAAAANIEAKIDEQSKSPEELHVLAMALLLDGKRNDAVRVMQRAVDTAGQKADAKMLSDLAAMYLARASFYGDDEGTNAAAALHYATRARSMQKTPEATWNLALAYEMAGRREDAIATWNEYRILDPSSPWAEEVKSEILPRLSDE